MIYDFKIEKGIKLPPVRLKKVKYPFDDMEVGDSFLVKTKNFNSIASPPIAAYQYGNRHNMKFTIEKQVDGIRIWRIE